MQLHKIKLPEKLEPFRGVIIFAVVLLLSNFFWKYNVLGDEDTSGDNTVTFWGNDISIPFNSSWRNFNNGLRHENNA